MANEPSRKRGACLRLAFAATFLFRPLGGATRLHAAYVTCLWRNLEHASARHRETLRCHRWTLEYCNYPKVNICTSESTHSGRTEKKATSPWKSLKLRIIHSAEVPDKFASWCRSLTLKYAFVRGVISATFAVAAGGRSAVVYPGLNITCPLLTLISCDKQNTSMA